MCVCGCVCVMFIEMCVLFNNNLSGSIDYILFSRK